MGLSTETPAGARQATGALGLSMILAGNGVQAVPQVLLAVLGATGAAVYGGAVMRLDRNAFPDLLRLLAGAKGSPAPNFRS